MKKSIVVVGLLFAFSLYSCGKKNETENVTVEQEETKEEIATDNKEFRIIEQEKVDSLNNALAENKPEAIEAVMQKYQPEDTGAEGKYSYVITKANTDKENVTLLTLVEDGLMDDSIKAIKVKMEVETIDGNFKVLSIQESYQCYQNRGHEDWSAEFCI
ncbi:hypothetical protein [Myroides phaeus]|uniref:Uncharacterized protein n=1 Tax=Myroides phaeus TaxID=702745 RepID=A0A1G8GQW3_9FLAO|nr:hypothetical protein [Myroides phaeus]MEC4117406.1 hypothetical protein [Myroides phaeus]SDH96671.1 hypothetical protein SAMN05421818_1318 [Myroides phaeus]